MLRIKKSNFLLGTRYFCAHCRERVSYLDSFCGYCGSAIEWERCPHCGHISEMMKDDFCRDCGISPVRGYRPVMGNIVLRRSEVNGNHSQIN